MSHSDVDVPLPITHFHRITECFGLEGTFRGHLAQPPCSRQEHLKPDRVAQSPVQPGLECFQGWGLHSFSGQSVPGFHHPYGKNFFLISSPNLPSTLPSTHVIYTFKHIHDLSTYISSVEGTGPFSML